MITAIHRGQKAHIVGGAFEGRCFDASDITATKTPASWPLTIGVVSPQGDIKFHLNIGIEGMQVFYKPLAHLDEMFGHDHEGAIFTRIDSICLTEAPEKTLPPASRSWLKAPSR